MDEERDARDVERLKIDGSESGLLSGCTKLGCVYDNFLWGVWGFDKGAGGLGVKVIEFLCNW